MTQTKQQNSPTTNYETTPNHDNRYSSIFEFIYPTLQALQQLGGEASNEEIDDAVIRLLEIPEELEEIKYEEVVGLSKTELLLQEVTLKKLTFSETPKEHSGL